MDALTIISPAYFTSKQDYWYLTESCKQLKLKLHLYGRGEPYPWLLQAKVVELRKQIAALDTEFVLLLDSHDAFMLCGQEEILDKMAGFTRHIVMSAEKKCWPQRMLAPYYPESVHVSPWCYLNSGGYIGKKELVLDMLEKATGDLISPVPFRRSLDWENDQFLLSLVYLSKQVPMCLDVGCVFFQNMGDMVLGEIGYTHEGRLVNIVTHSMPCAVHFNGHAPGIDLAFSHRFMRIEWNEQITTQS